MKVGVYIGNSIPESGGAYTLLSTIQEELKQHKNSNVEAIKTTIDTTVETTIEIIYLISNKRWKKVTILNGIRYVNIFRWNLPFLLKKVMARILHLLGLNIPFSVDYIAQEENIDLFWFAQPARFFTSYPYIFTVWDLGHRMLPGFPEVTMEGQWELREAMYQQMLPKACYVITGNEEGKKEIMDNYRVNADKIIISQFPVSSFCYGDAKKPNFDVPKDYFFYPAQFWAHKNHFCILQAVKILKEKYGLEVSVLFTGSDKGNKGYIENMILDMGLSNNIFILGFLSEEELKYLYTHATAMIFASLMGPNNLPPIEATCLGCPVIITDIAGHKEQLEDTALYFNGYKPEELATQMLKMFEDNDVREQLIEKQKRITEKFTNIRYCKPIFEKIEEFYQMRKRWA